MTPGPDPQPAPGAAPEAPAAEGSAAEAHLAQVSAWADSDPARALDALDYVQAQLDLDRRTGQFDVWARSTVIDENTRRPVLAAAVLELLGAQAGVEVRYPHANAGLVHTYGYLLSPAATPYGPKRARWTRGELAQAFGHAPQHFHPWAIPAGDSLLARATACAMPVADGSRSEHVLHRRHDPDGDGGQLVTTVWRAPGAPGAALVYAHLVDGRYRLVTTFPVAGTAEQLAALAALPATPRYNVVVGSDPAPRA